MSHTGYLTHENIIIIIIIYEASGSLVASKTLQKTEIQEEHLVWTVGNENPMHEVCIPHGIPRSWISEGEGRDKSRHKNNS